jgi:hypothetical protein
MKVIDLKLGYYMFGNKGALYNNGAHIAKQLKSETLCNTPMLSTNWCRIEDVKEIGCPVCLEKYNEQQNILKIS